MTPIAGWMRTSLCTSACVLARGRALNADLAPSLVQKAWLNGQAGSERETTLLSHSLGGLFAMAHRVYLLSHPVGVVIAQAAGPGQGAISSIRGNRLVNSSFGNLQAVRFPVLIAC